MSTPPWGDDNHEPTPPPPPSPPTPSPYQPYGAPASPYEFQPTPQTNGMAIASLVVSICSVFLCCGLPGVVGAILGHVARKQIREQGQAGEGMALAGVIVGWIAFGLSLAVVAVYVVLIVGGVVASESVDDCYYDSDGDYVCN